MLKAQTSLRGGLRLYKILPQTRASDDIPALSEKEKSTLSKVYWSKIWGKPPTVDQRERVEFLRDYVKQFDHSLCHKPDLGLIRTIIDRNDSSPGPDGIPFAAWRAASDLAAPVLFKVFEAISKGHLPPPGFNLYLLPNKNTGLVSD
jgi:hypothetical protein